MDVGRIKPGFGESVKNRVRAEITVRVVVSHEDCYNRVWVERLGFPASKFASAMIKGGSARTADMEPTIILITDETPISEEMGSWKK